MQNSPKILICGGGTGGHVFPAIAIANACREISPGCDILFIGASNRMEMKKVPEAGYPIEGLWISGIQRKLSKDNLAFPFKLLSSIRKSRKIIKGFGPDVVVGVGGYSSGPPLWVAARKGIPAIIQEQNSFPGITNRLLAKKVDKICVAYERMERFFPKDKIIFTGNPVRKEVINITGKQKEAIEFFGLKEGIKTLLVVGGSLGARTINLSMAKNLSKLQSGNIQVIWQTGRSFSEEAKALVETNNYKHVVVNEFINRMDMAYAAADMILSRAGAIAISELCAIAKPCILVPSPNVAEDHQTRNAEALQLKEAAILLPDVEVIDKAGTVILELMLDKEKMESMGKNIKSLARIDAAKEISETVLQYANSKNN